MYCLFKKKTYKTDKSHILSGKIHIFHMNILLIYHLINDFIPGAYCRKFTILIKNIYFKMVSTFYTLNISTLYNNYVKVLFLAA